MNVENLKNKNDPVLSSPGSCPSAPCEASTHGQQRWLLRFKTSGGLAGELKGSESPVHALLALGSENWVRGDGDPSPNTHSLPGWTMNTHEVEIIQHFHKTN